MKKIMTCIQCPKGCSLSVETENGKVISVSGNQCPKGEAYARQEIENPLRVLTSSVVTEGLDLKMVPVKTDQPIPKAKLIEAMYELKQIVLTKPVKKGDCIKKNLLGLDVNVIANRSAS